jgi:hypothetical protein
MWQSASMCVWQSPWQLMPRKSIPNRRLLESTGRSNIWVMWWIAGLWLSGPATVLMGIAMETERPDFTRPAARLTCSGVM